MAPAGRIPLRSIAEIVELYGPIQILRENTRRRIAVFANTDGSDLSSIVNQIRNVISQTELPEGYFTGLERQLQAQEEPSRRILLLSLVSLMLIFAVLYSRCRSEVLALITMGNVTMGNVPVALIGSVAALWSAGQSLSVAGVIAFITLAGIATRNGILKVSPYLNLAPFEGET